MIIDNKIQIKGHWQPDFINLVILKITNFTDWNIVLWYKNRKYTFRINFKNIRINVLQILFMCVVIYQNIKINLIETVYSCIGRIILFVFINFVSRIIYIAHHVLHRQNHKCIQFTKLLSCSPVSEAENVTFLFHILIAIYIYVYIYISHAVWLIFLWTTTELGYITSPES